MQIGMNVKRREDEIGGRSSREHSWQILIQHNFCFALRSCLFLRTSYLDWCHGTVVVTTSESSTKVKIKWDDECLCPVDATHTLDKLLKSHWNPSVATEGAWRESMKEMHVDLLFIVFYYLCTKLVNSRLKNNGRLLNKRNKLV